MALRTAHRHYESALDELDASYITLMETLSSELEPSRWSRDSQGVVVDVLRPHRGDTDRAHGEVRRYLQQSQFSSVNQFVDRMEK